MKENEQGLFVFLPCFFFFPHSRLLRSGNAVLGQWMLVQQVAFFCSRTMKATLTLTAES